MSCTELVRVSETERARIGVAPDKPACTAGFLALLRCSLGAGLCCLHQNRKKLYGKNF
jgi:hypothetical protein